MTVNDIHPTEKLNLPLTINQQRSAAYTKPNESDEGPTGTLANYRYEQFKTKIRFKFPHISNGEWKINLSIFPEFPKEMTTFPWPYSLPKLK